MWTLRPLLTPIRSRVLRRASPDLASMATRRRELFPPTRETRRPAIALEGQLDRVTGWVFSDEATQRRDLEGTEVEHAPTVAYDVEDVILLDGVLYKGETSRALHWRTHRLPRLHVRGEIEHGSVYSTWHGHRWFGTWLVDDCPRYLLAEQEGDPLTTIFPGTKAPHRVAYETRLGMHARHADAVLIRRAVIFDDYGQNADKRRRMRELRRRLLKGVSYASHEGVFILRGLTGDRRVCVNEHEIAELAAREHGLRIVDPTTMSVDEIIATCAGAQMVMGIEGSGLVHGSVLLDEGTTIFVLQPPNRFCSVFKDYADRDRQRFAYVVGWPEGEDFRIEPDDVRRTFDLIAAC